MSRTASFHVALAAWLCAGLLSFALAQEKPLPVNLLANPTFAADGDQLPKGWSRNDVGTGKRITAPEGVKAEYALELTNDNDKIAYFIQHSLKLQPNHDYVLKTKFRGDPKTIFQVYMECSDPWRTFTGPSVTCTGEWQDMELQANFAELNRLPYAVFRIKGAGRVCFTEPILYLDLSRFRNGDFELGNARWDIEHGAIVDTEGAHGNVLELTNLVGPAKATQTGITVKANQLYRLTYDVSGGVDKAYTDSQGATWFRITPQLQGQPVGDTGSWLDSFSSWQTKRLTFSLPQESTIDIVCELKNPGTVRFDNITLEECTSEIPPLEICLDLPFAFGNAAFPEHKAITTLSGILVSDLPISAYRVDLAGQSTEVKSSGRITTFALPRPLPVGKYPLTAVGRDANGKELATASLDFQVYPPSPHRQITFREDRVMLIDGKPFFPLGFWGVSGDLPLEEKLKRMVAAGFNVGKCGANQVNAFADAGVMAVPTVPSKLPDFKDQQQKELWRSHFIKKHESVMAHPAVISYFNIDEPAWGGRPWQPIQEAYRFIRELDPYRPIFLNEAPRGKIEDLRPYALASDAYGVDIYPIPSPNSHSDLKDKMMTSVGKYTDICKEVTWDRKPIWMTLQGFAWRQWNKPPNNQNLVYPNHAENRFMAYNAIVHGATGLFYWGFNWGLENWDFITELGRTIRELNDMSTVLTSPTVIPPAITADNAAIAILHKTCDGKNFYIVQNESGDPVTATFRGATATTWQVLTENRSLTAANGVFSDAFAPYDTHVYTDAAALPPPLPQPECQGAAVQRFQSTNDHREAFWVWYPDRNKVPGHQTRFIRDFEVPAGAEVELHGTADDLFRAYLNGKLVLEHNRFSGHGTISVRNVTTFIRPGRNRLAYHAADAGQPPAAALFALRITDKQSNVTRIVSDTDTICTETAPDNWLNNDFTPGPEWKPAQVLGKYGCEPWGANAEPEAAAIELIGQFDFPK